VKEIGKLGNKPGEFKLPTTIEMDSKGNFSLMREEMNAYRNLIAIGSHIVLGN